MSRSSCLKADLEERPTSDQAKIGADISSGTI